MKTTTKFICRFALCLVLLGAGPLSGQKKPAELTADEIMQEQNRRHAVDTEIEFLSLTTIAKDGTTRHNGVMGLSRKDENGRFCYLIRLLSPDDVKGVTLLAQEKSDKDVEHYLFMPAVGAVKKVEMRGKSEYFMNTDFTYEDLLKERSGDYQYERLPDAGVDDTMCFVIKAAAASARTKKNTAYSHRDLYVDQDNYNILKIDFYDLNGEKLKTLRAYDYKSRKTDGPTMRPLRAVMTHQQKGTTSVLNIYRSRLNFPLNSELFTPEVVKNWTPERDKEILMNFEKGQGN